MDKSHKNIIFVILAVILIVSITLFVIIFIVLFVFCYFVNFIGHLPVLIVVTLLISY